MRRFFIPSARRGGGLALLALLAMLAGPVAHAAGTAAGTTITNKATLSYSVGNVNQASIGSSPTGNTSGTGSNTSFVVDNKVNLSVTTSDSAPVSAIPGQTAVTTTFVVSNTGNNTQDFALSIANLTSGTQSIFGSNLTDNFDVVAASCSIQVGGVAQTYIPNLAPDASQTVKVVCPIPTGQLNGDIAGLSMTAEAKVAGTNGATALTQSATNDPNVVDIVFADGAGSDDAARDAKFSARSAYKVVTAALSVQKTFASVCDPMNGSTNPANIPGGYVQYIIAITNNGNASATLTQITDTLNANLTFDPDFISGAGAGTNCAAGVSPASATGKGFKIVDAARTTAGAAYPKFLTSAADGDGATFAGGTVTIDFSAALPAEVGYTAGELKVNETVQVIFQTKIN